MEIANVEQDIEKMNDAKVNPEKKSGDSIFKTFDRPYIKQKGNYILFVPIGCMQFDDKFKLAVNQLMEVTTRKAFVRKLRQSVIEPLFEELTSVFWVTPKESQLSSIASAIAYRNIELNNYYDELPYGNLNYEFLLKDLVFVELYTSYIRHIGTLSLAEKPNWIIKPSVNRKLLAKIRRQH